MSACICGGHRGWSEPKPGHQFFRDTAPSFRLMTTCCNCRQRADECSVKHTLHDPDDLADMGNWCGPFIRVECAPGTGCDANPRRRIGMHLREWSWAE